MLNHHIFYQNFWNRNHPIAHVATNSMMHTNPSHWFLYIVSLACSLVWYQTKLRKSKSKYTEISRVLMVNFSYPLLPLCPHGINCIIFTACFSPESQNHAGTFFQNFVMPSLLRPPYLQINGPNFRNSFWVWLSETNKMPLCCWHKRCTPFTKLWCPVALQVHGNFNLVTKFSKHGWHETFAWLVKHPFVFSHAPVFYNIGLVLACKWSK